MSIKGFAHQNFRLFKIRFCDIGCGIIFCSSLESFLNQQKLFNIIQLMQSTLKQHPNNPSANHQADNQPPTSQSKAPLSKEQQLSLSSKLSSQMNVQKTSSSDCNASKSLNANESGLPNLGKEQASSKPTNDRQEGNSLIQTAPIPSYPTKKNDHVIEILDDDEPEERKVLPSSAVFGLQNKQKFKNKQISNQLRSPSTNIKVDNYSNKINEYQKNETGYQKGGLQIPKPQSWLQKYSINPSKTIFDKHNEIPRPKHMQPVNKLPFSNPLPGDDFFHHAYMNSRPGLYDNIYPQGMGMNYPHSILNYPGSLVGDHLYWNNGGNPYDRFGLPPHNPNVPYNYMFGQNDHGMMGKNMPFMNHAGIPGHGGIPGMKGFPQMNAGKPSGLPEPLLKDDKLHPGVQKQLFNFNNVNDKRQQEKRKQPLGNAQYQQKDEIVRTMLAQSHNNHSHIQGNNAEQLEKRESVASMPQKKKQPQVIELLDSDQEDVNQIKNVNRSNSEKPVTPNITYNYRDQTYNSQLTQNPQKVQSPWLQTQPTAIQSYTMYQKKSSNPFTPTQQKQYPTGKLYKQQMDHMAHLEKTKQIQKQMRPDNYKGKSLSDDKSVIFKERLENLQLENLKEINEMQEKRLISLSNFIVDKSALYVPGSNMPFNFQPNPLVNKPANPHFPEQTMNPETYTQEKLLDLQSYFSSQNNGKVINQDKNKIIQEFKFKAGLEMSRLSENPLLNDKNKFQAMLNSTNRQQKPTAAIPYTQTSKQISGNEHVIRQVQKAFQKTRSRLANQQSKQAASMPMYNEEGKRLLTYERMEEIRQEGKRSSLPEPVHKKHRAPTMLKKDTNEKDQKGKDRIECENDEKDGGWVFEWTPKLKRLRDLSKKRQYDSVILTGPQFQADLPRLVTNQRQLRTLKAIKRANLLKRLYKYSAQI